MMAALVLTVAACGEQQNQSKKGADGPAMPAQKGESMSIRYVDADSLMEKYLLAKDFNEAATNMQNKYDAAEKQQQQKIASMEKEFQKKQQQNVYASNPSQAQADQASYQNAMNSAQQTLAKMQQDFQKQAADNSKQLHDSIYNYMEVYAKEKGYDMIVVKNADQPFYIDAKYNVTNEVVEGLNKRYNKVAKK